MAAGQESQPILYGGTMFVTTHTSTVAIDAMTKRARQSLLRTRCCANTMNVPTVVFSGSALGHVVRGPRAYHKCSSSNAARVS